MESKICSKCGERKGLDKFRTATGRPYNKHSHCKECAGKAKAKYRAKSENKARESNNSVLWRKEKSKDCPEYWVFWSAKQRAKKKGIEFSITVEDINIPDFCPIISIPILRNVGHFGPSENSPSLDRINPSKGYVKGNIQVLSNKANSIKNSASFEELILVGEWAKIMLLEKENCLG